MAQKLTPRLKLGDHTPRGQGEAEEAHGKAVTVRLSAAGKAPFDVQALSSWTVEALKKSAADVLEVPVAGVTLLYNGRVVLDPFSISDVLGDALQSLAGPVDFAVEFKQGVAKK